MTTSRKPATATSASPPVGFLYRYGYFTQSLSPEGQQQANYEAQDFTQLPIEQIFEEDGQTPLILEVPYAGHTVYSHRMER